VLKPLDDATMQGDQQDVETTVAGPTVRALNITNVAELSKASEFEWPEGSGNVYVVVRVPYAAGIQLNDLFYRIMETKKYESPVMLPILERQLAQMLRIMWSLAQPKNRRKRLQKRLRLMKNPFFKLASEGDIASLISFFLVRRMMSSVSIRYPAQLPKAPRSL
jgi:hypothetical protein